MASEYIINWTDDAVKGPLTIQPTERNETATSLILFGKGSPNYGEGLQENLIRLLENFASEQEPPNPTMGQVWYDTISKSLKVYDGTTFISQGVSTEIPAVPNTGDMYFNDGNGSLQIWDGVSWKNVATEDDIGTIHTDFNTHKNDTALHITPAQNNLLDAISTAVTGSEINALDGVTGNIQQQINAINSAISGLGNTIPEVNPTTPADGDIQVSGTTTAPVIKIYALGAWRQVFPAQYA